MKAIVVIPIWRQVLSDNEVLSLRRCFSVLAKHDIALISPQRLPIDQLPIPSANVIVVRFDDNFFESINGYNRLMLSERLYRRFSRYDYLLLYQLDAFVFEDQLEDWCARDYDYIGAPWIGNQWLQRQCLGSGAVFCTRSHQWTCEWAMAVFHCAECNPSFGQREFYGRFPHSG